MKRLLLLCALALPVAHAQATVDPPALPPSTTVNVDSPSAAPAVPVTNVSVEAAPGTPWYGNPGVLITLLGVPTSIITSLGAYRLGMRKTVSDAAAQRDAADLAALQIRDKSFADTITLLTETLKGNQALVADAASHKARLEVVEARQAERETREREQIAKIAALEERLDSVHTHLNSCTGGQPCPLTHLRRTS